VIVIISADTPKGGASKKAPVKPAQRAPTKVELESVLYWLLAIAVYCNEVRDDPRGTIFIRASTDSAANGRACRCRTSSRSVRWT
jgi:hypothetical protein